MNTWNITLAETKDTDEILKLYQTHLYGAADWNENYPSLETVDFDLSRDALFVMKNDKNEIIATISIDEDEEVKKLKCWSKELEPAAELSRLCVRKDMQNRGIAKQMMEYAFNELKKQGKRSVHILVKSGHNVALKAYSKFEYNEVGYCDLFGKHFICMERLL